MTKPTLRPYQTAAIEAIRRELSHHRSTLLVLPTGCGKTITFAEIARLVEAKGGRTLVLAHRGELLDQARAKIEALGLSVGKEQAQSRADGESVVVASVQSLKGERLASWARDAFRLVVVDEAHRATAQSYRDVLEHFETAKVLGVTATPDRLDGQGMGDVFQTCAFRYGLRQAIRDGWLVSLKAQRVHVEGLDLSAVRTVAGDLHQGDLDEAMRSCVNGVVEPLLMLAGSRPTIVFATSVAHAHALATQANAQRPGAAIAIDGKAKANERSAAIEGFLAGRVQFLINVGIFTEGFDAPEVGCVAVVRPTKSRALYSQMVGRGTRLAPGKSECLILDFAGNAGRHSLAGPADVLGGDEDEGIRALAEELMAGTAIDLEEALELAKEEAEARREQEEQRRIIEWWSEAVDPFLSVALDVTQESGPQATERQRDFLLRKGLKLPEHLSQATASQLIGQLKQRQEQGLATVKQMRLLRRHHIDGRTMSFEEAGETISGLMSKWRRSA